MTELEFPKEIRERIESIEKTLLEILKWTRFSNIAKLKETLETELDSDMKKLAYENSDGENSLNELVTISGAPHRTIGNWWPRWFRLGIVTESESRKGRMKKIISLQDIGIPIPRVATASPEVAEAGPAVAQAEAKQTEGDNA